MEQIEADALVVVAFEKENGEPVRAPGVAGGWIADLYTSGEFKGKILETALLHRPGGLKCGKLLAIGGGKVSAFGSAELRKLAGAAVRVLKPKGCRTIAFALDAGFASPEHVAAAVEGALLGDLRARPLQDGEPGRAEDRGQLLAGARGSPRRA